METWVHLGSEFQIVKEKTFSSYICPQFFKYNLNIKFIFKNIFSVKTEELYVIAPSE